jgi:hypothetical protein
MAGGWQLAVVARGAHGTKTDSHFTPPTRTPTCPRPSYALRGQEGQKKLVLAVLGCRVFLVVASYISEHRARILGISRLALRS